MENDVVAKSENLNRTVLGVTIEFAMQLIGDTPVSAGLVVGVGSSPRFIDCTIRNCEGASKDHSGGGVDVFGDPNAETVFRGCTIRSNRCGSGGGMAASGGLLRLDDCTIRDNTIFNETTPIDSQTPTIVAGGGGFMLTNDAVATMTNCSVINNHWDPGNPGYVTGAHGGGVDATSGELFMRDCFVIGNRLGTIEKFQTGGNGGGVSMNSDDVIVTSLFDGNIIYGKHGCYGGGISAVGGEISNCTLRTNTASPANHGGNSGGGAIATFGSAQVTNVLMHDNFAFEHGGGIRDVVGGARFVNCTVADNSVFSTLGGAYFDVSGQTSGSMTNCIVWGNESGTAVATCLNQIAYGGTGDPPEIRYTCFENDDSSCSDFEDPALQNITDDPQFVTTANGPYRIGIDSPCIDEGLNSVVPDDDFDVNQDSMTTGQPTPDLDLTDRLAYGGGFDLATLDCLVDMGIDETPVTCVVENAGDLNGDDSKDGLDIQPFVDCLLADPEDETCNCRRGDFRDDDGVNTFDIPLFVACIITAGTDCTVEFCPPGGGAIMAPPDCNKNGVPDDVDIDNCQTSPGLCDCNDNGIPDVCDIANEISDDANENSIPDECEPDCNDNDVPDDMDIADLTSADCDSNGVPDECDQDCDGDEIPDACETLIDCNSNGIFDACEFDCDNDGIPNACELSGNDCNGNNEPDDCEINRNPPWNLPDCNNNDVPDECELSGNDCNSNGVLDECDIANQVSDDVNQNGIPDECESQQQMMGGGGGSSPMMAGAGLSESSAQAGSAPLTEAEAWAAYFSWCAATDFSSMNNAAKFSVALTKRLELGLPAGQMLP